VTAPAEFPSPGRCGSRRKRWIVAGVLVWACAAYLLSVGPVAYAHARGWLSRGAVEVYVLPIEGVYELGDLLADLYDDYIDACEDAGERHAASS